VPVFMGWIGDGKTGIDAGKSGIDAGKGGHHFVHWYTNHGGGTDAMTDTLMRRLQARSIGYRLVEENAVTPAIIRSNRVLLVHSLREHNVIINNPDDFEVLLENSWVLGGVRE